MQTISDNLKRLLGKVPDSEVADKAGISRRAVCSIRHALKIPAFVGFILTQEEVPCRSILEAKYDAYLHANNIRHTHEVKYEELRLVADFVLDKEVIIEIEGMKGYSKYDNRANKKKQIYSKAKKHVLWFSAEEVEQLYQQNPIPLKFRDRTCPDCNKIITRVYGGRCHKCYMKYWHKGKDLKTRTCKQCGEKYHVNSADKRKFCSHSCYVKSMEFSWPPLEVLEEKLKTTSIRQLAIAMSVKYTALYMHLRRTRARQRY